MSDQEGFLKVRYSTAMVLAGIIFVANLFSGWLTQNREITDVKAEQKVIAEEQKRINDRVDQAGNRITAIEQCIQDTKESLRDVKVELKELNKNMLETMRLMHMIQLKKEPAQKK